MNTNKMNTSPTTREDIYVYIGRLEWLVKDLSLCLKHNIDPDFRGDDEVTECGEYAERICAYVRATHDEQVMIDCCKINRSTLYRFGNRDDDMGRAIRKARRYLFAIHNYTLTKIWGVSPDDVENCKYYINSVEGVCRNSTTGELLPRPANNTAEDGDSFTNAPTMGLPSEFDKPEAKLILAELEKLHYCKRVGAVYQWKGTNALFGYMVWRVSDKLGIRHDNDRFKWGIFQRAFTMTDQQIRTAKNALSKVQNKYQPEPTGFDDIDRVCK